MPYILEVGKPYRPGVPRLAPGINYNFRGGQHELLLILDKLKPSDIEEVRKGPCEFGALVFERIVFFLYRFGSAIEWSDAPYSIWQLPEDERIAPERPSPESRALLTVILVDADHNRIEALRAVTLSPVVTLTLQGAIAVQLAEKISVRDYQAAIDAAYRRWPSTAGMLAEAITCKGGD